MAREREFLPFEITTNWRNESLMNGGHEFGRVCVTQKHA
jgi:hypothetical protein